MLDHYNFTKAALGASGALFYSPLGERQRRKLAASDSNSSIRKLDLKRDQDNLLFFKSFQTWASASDWTLNIAEDIAGLAVGEAYAAALTQNGLIHVFSPSGLQRLCFTVPSATVCMAGGSKSFAVVWHYAPPVTVAIQKNTENKQKEEAKDGNDSTTQKNGTFVINEDDSKSSSSSSSSSKNGYVEVSTPSLYYKVFSPFEKRSRTEGVLPLSTGATLTYLGFSDGGNLVSCDSNGTVRMLVEEMGDVWVPVCDLKAAASSPTSPLWMYGLREEQEEIMCFIAHPQVGFPLLTVSPLPQSVKISLPFVERTSNAAKAAVASLNARRGVNQSAQGELTTMADLEESVGKEELKLAAMARLREDAFVGQLSANRIDGRWWRADPLNSFSAIGANAPRKPNAPPQVVRGRVPTMKSIRAEEANLDVKYVKMVGV